MNITEFHVKRLLRILEIDNPHQLNIGTVCEKLNMDIHYWERSSVLIDLNGQYTMFINQNINKPQQWTDFGHEMKHYRIDGGSQFYLTDSFKCYQEVKADYFAYHFCVPTFMLQQLRGVTAYDIARIFNVEIEFAFRRLEMYKSSVIAAAESRTVYS